ncbi:uncharacterized protein BXZ73DRAFT_74918 [Epithele typhae]|uniref:uncharacterized protein n=1 Tax=Epithele typhae TaxID=378194 RepID=UPI0020076908|nr:uncharacterized protein BXZ73DRAFT_74918 [Epithele typhae]KAH9941730.1 hypothetical protein BXZ73DRAFT_74918 [Epithele typhae]
MHFFAILGLGLVASVLGAPIIDRRGIGRATSVTLLPAIPKMPTSVPKVEGVIRAGKAERPHARRRLRPARTPLLSALTHPSNVAHSVPEAHSSRAQMRAVAPECELEHGPPPAALVA